LPKEVKDADEFLRLSEKADFCLVKKSRKKEEVKLKLRTKKYLYTLKVPPDKVDEILKNVRCEIREI